MKLDLTLPAVLACILVGFSSLDDAEARPLKRAAAVSLPLQRIHTVREDLHPQIVRSPFCCVNFRLC